MSDSASARKSPSACRFKNQLPQASVKAVQVPDLLKGGAGIELMIGIAGEVMGNDRRTTVNNCDVPGNVE